MLNMKKGLAIVLAAATVLTFAPVASLSNAVSAYAADATATIDASTSTKTADASVELPVGAYVIVENTKADDATGVTAKIGSDSIVLYHTDSTSYVRYLSVPNTQAATKITFDASSAKKNGTFTYTIYKVANVSENTTVSQSVVTASSAYTTTAGAVKTIDLTVKGVAVPTIKRVTGTGDVTDSTVYGTTYYNVNQGETFSLDFSGAVTKNGTNTATAGADYDADSFSFETDGLVAVSDQTTTALAKNGKITVKGLAAGTSTLKVSVKKGTTVYATGEFKINVKSTSAHISSFTWTDPANGKTAYFVGTTAPVVSDTSTIESKTSEVLDPLVNNTLQLNVTADSALTYVSGDTSIVTVSSTGLIKAVKAGITTVKVYAASDLDNPKTLNITVSDKSSDSLTVKYNGSEVSSIDLDPSTSTASTAVKSAALEVTSKAGLTVNYLIVSGDKVTTAGDSTIATVNSNGVVTAGTKTGTVYVYAYTNPSGNIAGAKKWIKVTVNALPAADITVTDPIVLDLTNHKTATLDAKSSVSGVVFSYNPDADALNAVSIVGNTVTAKKIGQGKITVTATATKTTRLTKKDITVSVVSDATKKVSDIKAAASSLTVKVGAKASAGVTATVASGSAITYTSDDTSVATVDADGTITALAPGVAVITASVPESKTMNAGSVSIKVTVPTVTPAKVTGVKVTNVKGAKVKVTWTKDSNPNVKYYVKKTIGSKSAGKSVNGSSTTLSVKKGATVKVKVKAYVYDASGKKLVGTYSTTVTRKTDKK